MSTEKLLSLQEVSCRTALSKYKVKNLIRAGLLTAVSVGSGARPQCRYVTEASLLNLIHGGWGKCGKQN